jgi:hypothetical protein
LIADAPACEAIPFELDGSLRKMEGHRVSTNRGLMRTARAPVQSSFELRKAHKPCRPMIVEMLPQSDAVILLGGALRSQPVS